MPCRQGTHTIVRSVGKTELLTERNRRGVFMDLQTFLDKMNSGEEIEAGSDFHIFMRELSQEALKITAEMNSRYHTPEELVDLMRKLTGNASFPEFGLFPPFYTDCGKNIHFGSNVFVNSGCRFQDQGGVYIGDNVLIGHNAVFATLNHNRLPEKRGNLLPAPIHIGKNVWLGANVTVCPGVTIGDGAIVAAGAVVTRDVEPDTVVGGIPARKISDIGR